MYSDMNNLDQLTKQHEKTMLLLNRAEQMESDFYLSGAYNPVAQDELTAVVDELIGVASELTGLIHDLKHANPDELEQYYRWYVKHYGRGSRG